ncbi:MAG: STAS domain-containing protein [Planctomycetes bacterium]|nr:STAS domain-containing protein [Planctomycetota bacterium]
MKIDTSNHDDYAVLTLKGEFDTFYCPALIEEVESQIDHGTSHLIIEMRLVKFINSTALGAMIKAHKRCRAEGGDLVIGHPSPFVRDVISKVGIDKLISVYNTEDEAVKAIIKDINRKELAGDAPVDQQKVLITFPDDVRNKMLGATKRAKQLVGTMANVDGNHATFTWSGDKDGLTSDQAKQLFFKDSELSLKFQVKMIKKGFFECTGQIGAVEDVGDGTVKVSAKFVKIKESERAALTQFAEDMAFLKQQLPGS